VAARPAAAGGSCHRRTSAFVLSAGLSKLLNLGVAGGLGLERQAEAQPRAGGGFALLDLACRDRVGWIGVLTV